MIEQSSKNDPPLPHLTGERTTTGKGSTYLVVAVISLLVGFGGTIFFIRTIIVYISIFDRPWIIAIGLALLLGIYLIFHGIQMLVQWFKQQKEKPWGIPGGGHNDSVRRR